MAKRYKLFERAQDVRFSRAVEYVAAIKARDELKEQLTARRDRVEDFTQKAFDAKQKAFIERKKQDA